MLIASTQESAGRQTLLVVLDGGSCSCGFSHVDFSESSHIKDRSSQMSNHLNAKEMFWSSYFCGVRSLGNLNLK